MIHKKSFWMLLVLVGFVAGIVFTAVSRRTPEGSSQTRRPSTAASEQGRQLAAQMSRAFESAAAAVGPSVVPIFSEQEVATASPYGSPDDALRGFFGDDFMRRFFGPQGGGSRSNEAPEQKQIVRGLGSGVIVSSDGYLLTNNHVVQGAEKLTIVMPNRKRYRGRVVGADPHTDIAVIKVDADGLEAAQLGNSDSVQVGQWVLAVGNPFQLLHTVTAGIISAKGRSDVGLADYEDFIQTDASINPGNSGGALADLGGNVIGINTAISTPSGGSVGIGFAIPINMARTVMDQLIKHGKVTRGYIGLALQDITDDLAAGLGLKSTEGALVGDVSPGGPAAKAGIHSGDVIVAFDGTRIESSMQMRNRVAQTAPGKKVVVQLLRDGHQKDVDVVLAERPAEPAGGGARGEQRPEASSSEQLGFAVQDLTPGIRQQLGLSDERGVVVTQVEAGSPAGDAGLQPGDLIQEVNRTPTPDVQTFDRAVRGVRSGSSLALHVQRGGNSFFVAIQVP